MTDPLARLHERGVAAFYRRLALDLRMRLGDDSLAAALLLHWLDGGGRTKIFPAHHVRNMIELRAYLRSTARAILLSIKAMPSGGVDGIVPRIRGTIKSNPPGGPYLIHLEGEIDTDLSARAKANQGVTIAEGELAGLCALGGWTVVSDVVMAAAPAAAAPQYDVKFERWTAKAGGAYLWTPDKHICVPNPDHGLSGSNAVAPGEKVIAIHHKHAVRVENAGMANPFLFESDAWDETDVAVVGPATVRV
jgi:hypothetical protein